MELNRPDIKIRPTKADQFVEVLSVALLLLLWIIAVRQFFTLPQIIPIHYNFKNQVDGYGSKGTIWILPIVGTFLFLLLSTVSKYPRSFNYVVKITPENAERQYRLAVKLLRALKCLILLMLSSLVFEIGLKNPFPIWVELLFILSIAGAIIYYVAMSTKKVP